jgi:ABC-2 type transport system permease protein
MNKVLVVAKREYTAAVRTKAFLISLLLMPIMMFGGIIVQKQTQKIADTSVYKVAVIDRTEGGTLATALLEAAKRRNEVERVDPSTGEVNGPAFQIEIVSPAPVSDKRAVDQQRLELSNRTRSKDLLGFIEIGSRFAEPGSLGETRAATQRAATQTAEDQAAKMMATMLGKEEGGSDDLRILYSTNQPTLTVFREWVQRSALRSAVTQARADKLGVNPLLVNQILNPPVSLTDRGMARTDANGAVTYESNQANMITNFALPIALVMLMFIAVMVGASPLATNIVEEKQLRIAEVLLGGLRPFELMFGKLLGGAATAITLASIYFAGIFIVAQRMDMLQYVRTETMLWFILFSFVGVMMYGSLFIAAGAAVTTMKEAQTTLTPVMLVVAMPFFVLTPIVQYPNGMLAKAAAFFPLTAPSVSIIRAAIPSGAPRWEMVVSAISAILGMLLVVWIAGRIFRAGMLLTSKPASMKEAMRWIISG